MCNGFISSTLSPFLVLSVRLARPSVASEHTGDSLGNLGLVANNERVQRTNLVVGFRHWRLLKQDGVCVVTDKDTVPLGWGVNDCSC